MTTGWTIWTSNPAEVGGRGGLWPRAAWQDLLPDRCVPELDDRVILVDSAVRHAGSTAARAASDSPSEWRSDACSVATSHPYRTANGVSCRASPSADETAPITPSTLVADAVDFARPRSAPTRRARAASFQCTRRGVRRWRRRRRGRANRRRSSRPLRCAHCARPERGDLRSSSPSYEPHFSCFSSFVARPISILRGFAFGCFGSRIVRTPSESAALRFVSSRSSGRVNARVKEP